MTGETDSPCRFKKPGFATLTTYVPEMFSIQQGELAAIPQCLELSIQILDNIRNSGANIERPLPAKSRVVICQDSGDVHHILERGINFNCVTSRETFNRCQTLPLVRSAVWHSYQLRARNCEVEIRWAPRAESTATQLADELAGRWKEVPPSFWNEENLRRQREKFGALRTADCCGDEILAAIGPFKMAGRRYRAEPATSVPSAQRSPAALTPGSPQADR
ncbi:hypothetical protein V8F20_012055 [Naviculisporaceae sp. PSN 640]